METLQAYRHLTDDQLVVSLYERDVHYLSCNNGTPIDPPASEVELLIGLSSSNNARVRSSLIALFLLHPRSAEYVEAALAALCPSSADTIKFFYTAAVLLQTEYYQNAPFCKRAYELPDRFSTQLQLVLSGDLKQDLYRLGVCHAQRTGQTVNWVGTYEHVVDRILHRQAQEAQWKNLSV